MNILFIGDIVGRPGRQAVKELLPKLKDIHKLDIVIANIENAAGGFGITPKIIDELIDYGVNAFTSGNHIWDKKEILGFIDETQNLVRPANYPPGVPGRGSTIVESSSGRKVGLVNLCGRVFMSSIDCPFRVSLEEIEQLSKKTNIIIIDMHAEATSEKIAMGWHLDGKVSAVIGTHTHVQTADDRILPKGSAYISDIGMTGSLDSVIGLDKGQVLKRFLTQMPQRFETGKSDIELQGVVLEIDIEDGKAQSIKRIRSCL